ncbi:amidohydrolase [Paenibacillus sp. J22TS3]|uniref:amidohydrolase n=1 Tax=Paenibacillus sp. J22TS3 TaxID=2807192 RepID=UPI001AFD840B|nr:amidohydrolase family protein [Paenibacillus sp. J22TS3]GIP23758.1 hydrolase [Paenibacillus sp. J22TS3]
MVKNAADLVLVSKAIFTGDGDVPMEGYVAVKNDHIVAVGQPGQEREWIGPDTKVFQLGDQLVMPGIHDNHVFFTGYMSMHRGVDLSNTQSASEALDLMVKYSSTLPHGENVYAYGWDLNIWGELPDQSMLDTAFLDRAVIAINRSKNWCWMNQLAIDKYHFQPGECSAEARAHLLKEMLGDTDTVKREFLDFCSVLAERGVTSIKDIGFDDYSGMLQVLSSLEEEGRLPLRVHFSLEPVLDELDTETGLKYKELYSSDRLRFQGYKIMLDGVVADHTADMLEPYADMPGVTNLRPVDYAAIEEAVLRADRAGLKCCLTAEGDAAIRKAVDMLEKCRQVHGERDARHSISDLEYPHPDDLKRMASNGIFAEIYAQILLLNPSREESYMAEVAGEENASKFYDYRTMLDSGVTITIGTDLPLFMTSVPDSIFAATVRRFPEGSASTDWYPEKGLPLAEVLKAWTIHGAKHAFMEHKVGTLKPGKYADIAVFDRNLFTTRPEQIREAKADLTIANGKIVHDRTSG